MNKRIEQLNKLSEEMLSILNDIAEAGNIDGQGFAAATRLTDRRDLAHRIINLKEKVARAEQEDEEPGYSS